MSHLILICCFLAGSVQSALGAEVRGKIAPSNESPIVSNSEHEIEIDRLIDLLGSPHFKEREAAATRLQNIGEPALAQLETATNHTDPEIRKRAESLVKVIAERVFVELRSYTGHRRGVEAAVFSPDGRTIFSADRGGVIREWEVQTGKTVRRWRAHGNWFPISSRWIECLAISPDGGMLASGGRDTTTRLWELRTGKELHRWTGTAKDDVNAVTFSHDGRQLLVARWRSGVHLCNVETGEQRSLFNDYTSDRWWTVFDVGFSPDGSEFVYTRGDSSVRRRILSTAKEDECYRLEKEIPGSVTFSPDAKHIVSGNSDHTIRVWDVAANKVARILRGHASVVQSVAVSPDGKRIISGSNDKTVRIWNLETGRELCCLRGHTDIVNCVTLSPCGTLGLSSSSDKTIKLWRLSGSGLDQ